MIQLLLTGALALVMLFAFREWRVSRAVGLALFLIAACGITFVWLPGSANAFARVLGVGRGADLVLYVYCVVSFLLILNMSLKIRTQHEVMTELARRIAIAGVRAPPRVEGDRPDAVA
ncbi:MAG TPA: DUF2304 domain-containing protein [Luteimonas sp.]|nr:DUF2304 domain-containing protein [Luteimonas sp.]